MEAERYRSPYTEDSPYARAVALLAGHVQRGREDGAVVVDVGCGYGAVAEPVRSLGLGYLGLDLEAAGLEDLARRGFEVATVDLGDRGGLGSRLEEVLAGRPLAALLALDVVEHLTDGVALLATLSRFAAAAGGAPLVVSIPNVTHVDLAGKLLLGRWDVTPVGLLDVTHVSLYSPARLERDLAAGGWREVGARDFPLEESDQHFPPEAAPLAATPLRQLLEQVRAQAAPGAKTNQFVRAYLPVVPGTPAAAATGAAPAVPGSEGANDAELPAPVDGEAAAEPFLSVLLVAEGASVSELADVLLCLDAQRSEDFELLVLVPPAGGAGSHEARRATAGLLGALSPDFARRVRLWPVPAGRGAALQAGAPVARGRYLSWLDHESVVFPDWVGGFARLAAERPGSVVRCLAALQPVRPAGAAGAPAEPAGAPSAASAPRFVLAEHVFAPLSPPGSYALPRSCFVDLGLSFAGAVAGAEEEDLLLQAAMLCGVHEGAGEVTSVRRRRLGAGPDGADDTQRQRLAEKLDAGALLLPAGSVGRFWDEREALRIAREDAARDAASSAEAGARAAAGASALAAAEGARADCEAALAAARRELEELRRSTSWRLTAPLRRLGALRSPR